MVDYKEQFLIQRIDRAERPLVAYSGGVDSTLLLFLAVSRRPGAAGIFVDSPLLAPRDRAIAEAVAARHHLPLHRVYLDPLSDPEVAHNRQNRCYHCKKMLFAAAAALARANGFSEVWDGTNRDDADGHRPGQKASAECGVFSPLREAGLTKTNVRELARKEGLSNADRPANPCLLTRFPYDLPFPIRKEHLARVAQGEEILAQYLVNDYRLRQDGLELESARIEAPEWDMERVMAHRHEIVRELAALGYRHISLDLAAFASGSFDRERQKAAEEREGETK